MFHEKELDFPLQRESHRHKYGDTPASDAARKIG